MGTRIQSRACGLNVEFHIELCFFFVCLLYFKVILCHSKTQGGVSTRPRLEYAQLVVTESSVLGIAEA